jgi:hypothetical protein
VQATWNLHERAAAGALARAVALAQPWVDVVLSGAATVGQLRSNPAARAPEGMTSSNGGSPGWSRTPGLLGHARRAALELTRGTWRSRIDAA